eukprot:scaffold117721_cov20-Tisochrysis_lutea.AAC.3
MPSSSEDDGDSDNNEEEEEDGKGPSRSSGSESDASATSAELSEDSADEPLTEEEEQLLLGCCPSSFPPCGVSASYAHVLSIVYALYGQLTDKCACEKESASAPLRACMYVVCLQEINEQDLIDEWGIGVMAANPEEQVPLAPEATTRWAVRLACPNAHAYTHTHTHTQTHTPAPTYAPTHTPVPPPHTRTHTYTRTHTRLHARMHTTVVLKDKDSIPFMAIGLHDM